MLVTIVTKDRRKIFANPAFAREAIESLYRVQERYPFLLYGFVIMPDHCHFLLQIPESGSLSVIMRAFKYGSAFNVGIGPIWQRGFHLRIPDDASTALNYIHQNPLKADLIERPEDYHWSSASNKWDVTDLPWSM